MFIQSRNKTSYLYNVKHHIISKIPWIMEKKPVRKFKDKSCVHVGFWTWFLLSSVYIVLPQTLFHYKTQAKLSSLILQTKNPIRLSIFSSSFACPLQVKMGVTFTFLLCFALLFSASAFAAVTVHPRPRIAEGNAFI